jgi:hypothetical protein
MHIRDKTLIPLNTLNVTMCFITLGAGTDIAVYMNMMYI